MIVNPLRNMSFWLAVLLVLTTFPLVAQETTGTITGMVSDASGAAIPSVKVTITSKDTGKVATTTSGSSGVYRIGDLPPGRYSATFEATGFSRSEVPDVLILLGRRTQLGVTMEVGQVEQVVQVTDAAPLIDTTSTMVAHNVTAEEFDRLPKGRSFQALAVLSPSVTTGMIEGGFQVNGASAAENNYYIDGVSTTSLLDGRARQNAVFEYLQEVEVKTNGLEAEYGGALGGVVAAVTKSGGNDFHGEAHYYYYGNKLAAGPTLRMQLNPETQKEFKYIQDEKGKNDYHEFGGSLGGPIIPNKLFFFTSASPRWNRATLDYKFSDGPGTMSREAHQMSWFNKLSFDPVDRVRTNFTWLYTPQYRTGSLYAWDGYSPNESTRDLASAQGSSTRGYNQPEQSYTGSVDITVSNTALLSVRAGRYYLNYKEVGIPYSKYYWWYTSSVGLEGVPQQYQQLTGYTTPSSATTVWDITTRSYVQADYSQFVNALGQHNFKAGVGVQKNVNNVNDSWTGPDGRAIFFWGLAFRGDQGDYGYYQVDDGATTGSAGATITHMYIQDQWRIHPRLTLSLGLRAEREYIPSFQRDVQEYAFKFGFGDKLAPRLGASFDLLGNGKVKISGAWGRYFDWTKFELARGTFGGDIWHTYYRSLDSPLPDLYTIDLNNMPGRNLWTGEFRDRRIPGFDLLDPNVKPMSIDSMNAGVEYEIRPQTVVSARWVRSKLNRTIEDLGALDAQGNEVYSYGNPGEGNFTVFPASGATCVTQVGDACGFPMPKAERVYNAMQLSVTRRFSGGWFASANYVYSKLWGDYAGLQSTDEIRPSTLGYGFSSNQIFGAEDQRPGGNANRYFDLDEILYDAHGNLGPYGVLPTDRPHMFKLYGSKTFRTGTEIGGVFRVSSGTPVSTQVTTINSIGAYVEGRGDLGRTPVISQTDLMIGHEFQIAEGKRLRLEFNMENLFNQKTGVFTFDRYNREEHANSAGIDLSETDLSKGYDWRAMVNATTDAALGLAVDPRYGKESDFNDGFAGRFLIKFIF